MTFVRRYRVSLVLLVLLSVVAVLVIGRLRDQQARAVPRQNREIQVGVIKPDRRPLDVTLSFTGDVLPNRQTPIFAKTSGYIRAIYVERGEFVKAGKLLVEIEPTEMENALDQSRAALASAQATYRVSQSNLDSAKANLLNQQALLLKAQAVLANDQRQADRMNELFSKGLVAAQDRDNARTTFEASQAALSAQQAQVEAARVQIATTESQLNLAQTQIEQQRSAERMAQMHLDDTRIVAPFSGYISQRNLEVGAAVSNQAAATSNASIGILMLQEINPVKVQLEVPERDVAKVGVGNVVRLTTDAYQNRQFSGKVARVVHALDPRTRTMGLEVDIPNPDDLLKPGMYARVDLLLEVRKDALMVPMETLAGGEGRPAVLIVRGGKVATVPVELGPTDGPAVQITKGVEPDTEIIIQGKDLVREGMTVRTVPAKSY
jgi:HlyD family secretion protein